MNLSDCQDFCAGREHLLEELNKRLNELERRANDLERLIERRKAARDIISAVAVATQANVERFLEDVVSTALGSVFPDLAFDLEYSVKRNQSEAQPFIVRNGQKLSPRDDVGCGVVDVCAFGFRLALWALQHNRTAPVFVFDEPFKWVSRDLSPDVARMFREVVNLLGIQTLLITHNPDLASIGDVVYQVSQVGGASRVTRVQSDRQGVEE